MYNICSPFDSQHTSENMHIKSISEIENMTYAEKFTYVWSGFQTQNPYSEINQVESFTLKAISLNFRNNQKAFHKNVLACCKANQTFHYE